MLSAAAPPSSWRQILLGGGGFVTGLDIAPDGTRLVRTDTTGAPYWNAAQGSWINCFTVASLPDPYKSDVDFNYSIWEVAIAYSNTQRFYIKCRGTASGGGQVFRTDDRGVTLVATNFVRDQNADAFTSVNRLSGQKMAVDPVNADVVYVSDTTLGAMVSADAGGTVAALTSLGVTAPTPAGSTPGNAGIVFDPSGGTTGGKTKNIYVPSWGNGVWFSGDAGATWTQLTTGTGPTQVWHATIASDGTYYATDKTHCWRYRAGTWTQLGSFCNGAQSICPDPSDVTGQRIVFVGLNGGANVTAVSADRGATSQASWSANSTRVATDIPWLAWTNENYMTLGDAKYDPTTGLLNVGAGIGLWTTTIPTSSATPITFTSNTLGIENLVPLTICSPPGGNIVFGVADRGIFYNANTSAFPLTQGPNTNNALIDADDISYSAGTPTFLAAILEGTTGGQESGYSSNGGASWTKFAAQPYLFSTGFRGGCMAVNANDITNIIWIPSNNGDMWVTTNKGVSWSVPSISGVSASNPPTRSTEVGWGFAYYLNRHIIAADQVSSDTFYAFNYIVPGIFKSIDKGATWTKVLTGNVESTGNNGNTKLRAVPGSAGHLVYTNGQVGNDGDANPANTSLWASSDGGATWAKPNANVKEVYDIGFGAPRVNGGIPTWLIIGWVNSIFGVWYSEDSGVTWTLIGTPQTILGTKVKQALQVIQGDMNTFGICYVGFGAGNGFAKGVFR